MKIALKGSNPVEMRRALVVLASAQKMKMPEIFELYHLSQEHIRHLIHAFNQHRLEDLRPRYRGGRLWTFTEEQRVAIIELAQIPPNTLGLPFTHWSLSKLKEEAERRGIVTSIGIETIRVILEEVDITYQHTKTWKASMILSLRHHRSKRLYVVLDNFSPHKHRTVTEWAAENNVELVFTPTQASWLNRIECHFAPLRSFVLRGSHYPHHEALATAIRSYLRW
ncbi:hypothetical protein CVV65_14665 [Kyrpidia spormannii]|uniref:Tc1-like transposase DDE domain-containing protein n=1 Tax=Kyrpidia spormannii TaxID=2055160 RepID=A0A2K8NA79_9BACL|nr:helix-turn-helix domain-containing protein [Kyrpidia spormannii]ATY86015.1 hypothetical protein CVV65_14665 [Kyrpidia spormannii]